MTGRGKHTHDSLANGLWTKGYLIASQTPVRLRDLGRHGCAVLPTLDKILRFDQSPTRVQRGAENSIRSYRYQKREG